MCIYQYALFIYGAYICILYIHMYIYLSYIYKIIYIIYIYIYINLLSFTGSDVAGLSSFSHSALGGRDPPGLQINPKRLDEVWHLCSQ